MKYRTLNGKGVGLSKEQLEKYLEKLASEQELQNYSYKETYPIYKLKERFEFIEDVYHLLNYHVKLNIPIHPAGEWLLDNFYIIEEAVKNINLSMPLKKYKKFVGISNGENKGFARIYVLAYEIINCSDCKINYENIKNFLLAYQKKKNLSMEEIWNLGIFMQIAIIQNIADICEKIYYSQIQKAKAESIFKRLVENKTQYSIRNVIESKFKVREYKIVKYPFIEHLSYMLKMKGKRAIPFLMALEEQVNKTGMTVDEIVKKEHFDIALKKVAMANCILSMKELLRMDFGTIFEETNEVEEILKKDPANVYEKMDIKTKEYYRNKIENISNKTKYAESYIAKKALQLCNRDVYDKKKHIGYYLIDEGINELYDVLGYEKYKKISNKLKSNLYIYGLFSISIFIDFLYMICFYKQIRNTILTILIGILIFIPIEEIVSKIIQYVLSKIVKPKLIPKMNFENGIPKEESTFVVIPTILNSKEKVNNLMKKLEIYYLANKSENIYFALLGDCTSGKNKEEKHDKEVIEEGIKCVEILNKKYCKNENDIPRFYFTYRKRMWNGNEECYLGWERKRGLLSQFNNYLIDREKNSFYINTMENNFPKDLKIKYIITLDSDTELILNSGLELIGAMAHVLNKPILNKKKDLVIEGHAMIQPRVGISLDATNKNLFTKIFAGNGGIDNYTNAISDLYQDNFGEGIFTGKGIYDLEVFANIMKKEIPENTVLSHDLLEGSYLRCGLASDICLTDGYPTSYESHKNRLHRWIRGDFQIIRWACKTIIDNKEKKKENPLNNLSRYKIIDNLIRALNPIFIFLSFVFLLFINSFFNINIISLLFLIFLSFEISTVLDLINNVIYKKYGQSYQKTFNKRLPSYLASIIRGFLKICELPYKTFFSLDAIIRSIYRMFVSKKYLLEWTTSEETDKLVKKDLISYYKNMISNVICGFFLLIYSLLKYDSFELSIIFYILSLIFLIGPFIFCYISKEVKKKSFVNEITAEEKDYLNEIGKRTWKFFKDGMTKENNYLPPDNYQEGRKDLFTLRTSSTNIGLGILSIISSYDLGYESLEDTLILLNKVINTIEKLPKWNGHLYNWYNIKTLEPLSPRYVSTVDNGNFISYIYVLKEFYRKIRNEKEYNKDFLKLIPTWVDKPINEVEIAAFDFSKLYNEEKGLLSIGFNAEENILTDSYYDLLASEARTASLVAISKKDVPLKHWRKLSRTMTKMNLYNGLISWSGTAFEYLMPTIVVNEPKGSLLEESTRFMLMLQKIYAKGLSIPWGFSESAYNLKDLYGNYQYKAIGLPWLGLKRGLDEDIVVSSYASFMALTIEPKEVMKNIKRLDNEGMYDKYGFYESIDYTPERMPKGKKEIIVKTYMAHHQGLILLSINNFFNNNIMKNRFSANPEIGAVETLLEETMPEKKIITGKDKKKPEKIKYHDYENNACRTFTKTNTNMPTCNVISNDNYSVLIDVKGNGYSKYNDYLINKYIQTSSEMQGIFFYIKNIKNNRIWMINESSFLSKADKYEITFSEYENKIKRCDGQIDSTCKITIAPDLPVEIRNIKFKNNGIDDETLEITSVIEPILDRLDAYISHPSFKNMFLIYEFDKENNIFIIRRKDRISKEKDMYLGVSFYTKENTLGDIEFEIDKAKFNGRGNLNVPEMVKYSKPFSNKIDLSINPILAQRTTITISPNEEANFNLIISVANNKEEVISNIKQYQNEEKVQNAFELSKAKADAESRYLGLTARQIENYQKMLGLILFSNKFNLKNGFKKEYYPKEELWKYGISGDLPIVVVKIENENEIKTLKEVLKAYEFYRIKNIDIDLIIINKEPNSYERYTKEAIQNTIMNLNMGYLQNIKGGIFIFDNEDTEVIEFYSKLIIETKKGPLENQLKDLEDEFDENKKEIGEKIPIRKTAYDKEKENVSLLDKEKLLYYNEYGGFSEDGKEYLIQVDKENRTPTVWSHIIANEKFGTIVTESMGGYTYSNNSRLNKITSWSNNQVIDEPSEVIYMQDEETLNTWSLGLNPMENENKYKVTYGFGYAKYENTNEGINQKLTVFVPKEDSLKISLLELKNTKPEKKKLNIYYYANLILGEDDLKNNKNINIDYEENNNILFLNNKSNVIYNGTIYCTCNEKIKSYTGSKEFFLGRGNISNPEGLRKVSLDNEIDISKNDILVYQIEVELEAFENKDIIFILGEEENKINALDKAYQYIKLPKVEEELTKVKKYWSDFLGRIQITTPVDSFNILMNGWLIYQTYACRLNAKTSFYQCGGAFGFRDQLQDTIALKYFSEDIQRKQILKHSRHQFFEGDVEHWWHEETSRGIRTRFSDDLLWLVYLVEDYISYTNDYSILDEVSPYLEGEKLSDGVDEKYDAYNEGNIEETIYEHCMKALKKGIQFGKNDLCKIGSGDWNDGLSNVGNKGEGESIWLSFFVYNILDKWIPICKYKNENEERINEYKNIMERLKKNLNNIGWDGRWYRRAFTDDGRILGSIQNEECKIDGIAQSWAVISNAGDNDKKFISMESLENHLVDKENGIIKLLDPPFEKSDLEPGYIKAYLPGTRENGGQYTHAAIWAIIAETMLGFGDKAVEWFRMINPIEHSKTKETANKYKVEPYVVPADIYGIGELAGRGGWTWYTGSSSWMYELGLHYILGLIIENGYLSLNPCIPKDWKEYKIHYKYKNTIYNILVNNPNSKNFGVTEITMDGDTIKDKKIKLIDDNKVHYVSVTL